MENLAEFNLFTTKNFVIYLIIIKLIKNPHLHGY